MSFGNIRSPLWTGRNLCVWPVTVRRDGSPAVGKGSMWATALSRVSLVCRVQHVMLSGASLADTMGSSMFAARVTDLSLFLPIAFGIERLDVKCQTGG